MGCILTPTFDGTGLFSHFKRRVSAPVLKDHFFLSVLIYFFNLLSEVVTKKSVDELFGTFLLFLVEKVCKLIAMFNRVPFFI